ncbi:IS66 family insertion sequence element accessory protein TnpB [Pseudofulvimonas gallinarii]|uniref:IS66 family insertion sequence element accessory protein TnpB n=1 Tax=Pseudofulvimonas gallinarii TaxID=634155 RepID=UPI0035E9DFC6
MLSLTSWRLVTAPTDLRCGMDRLLVQVRAVLGREPVEGEAYVFGNRARTRLKLLSVDRHGVWLAVRRLHDGGYVWPRAGESTWTLSADQFAWLCAGVDWRRLSMGRMSDGQRV